MAILPLLFIHLSIRKNKFSRCGIFPKGSKKNPTAHLGIVTRTQIEIRSAIACGQRRKGNLQMQFAAGEEDRVSMSCGSHVKKMEL